MSAMLMIGEWGMSWAFELLHGLLERAGGEPLRHQIEDDADVLGPLRGAGEARIARELGLAEHRAEPLEEVLGGRGEDDPVAVERLVGAARPARVLEAAALADDALPAVERRACTP